MQYTNVVNPNAATPDASWTTLGQLDYQSAASPISKPERRHLYGFTPVTATAVRIITAGNTGRAIDEIEIYQGQPSITLEQSPGIALISGVSSVDFGNIAPATTATLNFIVRNPGSATLILQSVTADNDYLPSSPSATTIAPGSSATFSVSCSPTAYGPRVGTLHLVSNDPAIPDFGMLLFSNALTPIEAWRGQYFGTIANTGLAADDADPNHNGLPNLVEYALGGEPLLTSSVCAILPQSSIVANNLQFQFTRQPALTDITLTVQASEDLTIWTDIARSTNGAPVTALLPGLTISETPGNGLLTVQLTDPLNPRRFLRLNVTR